MFDLVRLKETKPLMTNDLSCPYHLDESTVVFSGIGRNFSFLFSFFDENTMSKQNSPRCDAAICGVTSGAILFANVPLKRTPGLYGLIL